MRRVPAYRRWTRLVAMVSLVGSVQFAMVEQSSAQPQVEDSTTASNWRFSVTPYYWASAIAGSLTLEQPNDPIHGGNTIVDIGADHLSPGFAVFATGGKGRWGAEMGVFSSSVADSGIVHFADVSRDSLDGYYDFAWSEASVRGSYRIGPYLSPYVTLYAGIRWINWKYDLFGDSNNELGKWDETWIDPMLGAQTSFGLGAGFSAHAHVDAAGFGLGGSQLSWTISGGLSYHVHGPVSLVGTYAFKQVSYDNDKTGSDLLIWKDGVAQGWFMGASFSFPARGK